MLILTVFLQQQQHATASPLESRSPSARPELVAAVKSRVRKRHSSWHEQYAREMNSRDIAWANPCGGQWHHNGGGGSGGGVAATEMVPSHSHRIPAKKILRMLQNSTGKEQRTIKANTPIINISDISMWSLHKEAYKFLPVLKLNSNIALRRWHRQVQLYVASFAYLRRAQMTWDYAKLQHESAISKELLKLKHSARGLLCEIESAINSTSPPLQGDGRKRRRHQLIILPRERMEKRLRFQTHLKDLRVFEGQHTRRMLLQQNQHHQNHQRHQQLQQQRSESQTQTQRSSEELPEVYSIDLKFTKYRYFGYLRTMLKILRTHARHFAPMSRERRTHYGGSSELKFSPTVEGKEGPQRITNN